MNNRQDFRHIGDRLSSGIIWMLAVLLLAFAPTGRAAGQGWPQTLSPGQPANAQPDTIDLGRRPVLRFLTDVDYPPFNYHDEDGALAGFNIDLARSICLELGATCDIKPRPWGELLAALQTGEADAVIAGHAITARALAQVDFSDRYFHLPGRFVASRSVATTDVTPEGLYGKRIGVPKGSAHEAYLRAFFRDSVITAFDTADAAREAIMAGRLDYLFDDGVGLVFWTNGTASRECCELRGGPFLEPRFFGDGMAIAVPKTDPQVRVQINAALKRVRSSGRYEELLLRYFPARVF
jgi:polar amino acid transport system substrate-binding protein